MARHASSDGTRRGIAAWPIVTAIVVLVLAAAVVAYLLIVNNDDDPTQADCSAQAVLPVAADTGSVGAVTSAAASFDATLPVARSACITTDVTAVAGPTAAQLLEADWQPPTGAAPGVWVVNNESDLVGVEESDSALTSGRDNDPMASSPVVLAMRADDVQAAADLSWTELPDASGPDGTLVLAGDRRLILALPDPRTNRATSYALQSVAAGSGNGATAGQPVTTTQIDAAKGELASLGPASPADSPATTAAALDQLAAGQAPFAAVPVVASDLQAYNDAADPGFELVAVHPSGPTVGDEVFVVPLSASWVDPTMKEAAAAFIAYLRSPAGQSDLINGGLLVIGAAEPSQAPAAGSAGPTASSGPTGSTGSTGSTGEVPAADAVLPSGGGAVDAAAATAIGL